MGFSNTIPTLFVSILLSATVAMGQKQMPPETAAAASPNLMFMVLSQTLKNYSWQQKKRILEKSLAIEKRNIAAYADRPQFEASGSLTRRLPETDRNQALVAKLNYTVYDFGKSRYKLAEADLESDLKDLELKQGEDLIAWQIAKRLVTIINSKKIRDFYKTVVDASVAKKQTIQAGVQKGLRPTYDLKISDLEGAQYILALTRAQGELEIAISDLESLIYSDDQPQTGSLVALFEILLSEMKKTSPSKARQTIPAPPAWLEKIKSLETPSNASLNDPKHDWDHKIKNVRKEKLEAVSNGLKAQDSPDLLLGLEAQYGGSWTETKPSYLAQMTLRWLIPWSGKQNAERALLNIQSQMIDLDYESDQSSKKAAIAQAETEIQTLKQTWDQLDRLYNLKNEIYGLTLERYQQGKASSLEVAQLDLDLSSLLVEKLRTSNRGREVALQIAINQNSNHPERLFEKTWD